MSSFTSLHLLFLFIFLSAAASRAQVPKDATFTHVNSGDFGEFIVEYDASYRMLQVFRSPFQLAFYNTTPGQYTLALRMGLRRSESLFRWVWEANRGNPVGENATFSLRTDGNLVLANADGKIAWQTNTAGKGVVRFELLSTGNMVLLDKQGKFVWQSFDSATDTLLVGQSLRAGGTSKLVSRLSPSQNKDGPYTLELEPDGLSLYYKKMRYFSLVQRFGLVQGTVTNVTLRSEPDFFKVEWEMELKLSVPGGNFFVGRSKYNGTSSFMRLGIDGSLRVYTYDNRVDIQAWEVVFSAFRRRDLEAAVQKFTEFWESECQLPERCGSLGVCEDDQCVACPTEKGLLGWSRSCAAKKVSCNPSQFHYFKVEGVNHFLSKYNRGSSVSETDCGKKCTSDCKCLGYFYNKVTSRCWLAPELKTLTRVANSSHVGYIKTPNL